MIVSIRYLKPNLRVHIAPLGFDVERISEPVIREKADKLYLIIRSNDIEGARYLEEIRIALQQSRRDIEIVEITADIWNLFDLLNKLKFVFDKELESGSHVYVNVSTGSKIASIAGTLACMIWKGIPYYAHVDYDHENVDQRGIKHQEVTDVSSLPVYSINTPKIESLKILQILNESDGKIKKKVLMQKLEEDGIINSKLGIEAKHSKLRGLLNRLSIASDNPEIKVDYKGRQSSVLLTPQGQATLKIFGS
jgi:hypothetical protein